jgi:hypothetical protein
MNWYYAVGIALIGFVIVIPMVAASKVLEEMEAALATNLASEHLDA